MRLPGGRAAAMSDDRSSVRAALTQTQIFGHRWRGGDSVRQSRRELGWAYLNAGPTALSRQLDPWLDSGCKYRGDEN